MTSLVSIIIVSWNSRSYLERCLSSLAEQNYANVELIIVDNASEDDSVSYIKQCFPAIQIVENEINAGFSKASNQGFAIAKGDILVGLNPDTIVDKNWLNHLLPAFSEEQVGLVAPRILNLNKPNCINACGLEYSLTSLAFCVAMDELASTYDNQPIQSIACISGAAFAMRRTCYEAVSGFDETYFIYYEDVDLSWRVKLAGFDIKLAPSSIVYHHYKFQMNPKKLYWIERNRHTTLLKCLSWQSRMKLAPALLLGELIVWGFALWQGSAAIKAKFAALIWIFQHKRQLVPIKQQNNDQIIIQSMTPRINFEQVLPNKFGALLSALSTPLLKLNKWFVRISS